MFNSTKLIILFWFGLRKSGWYIWDNKQKVLKKYHKRPKTNKFYNNQTKQILNWKNYNREWKTTEDCDKNIIVAQIQL